MYRLWIRFEPSSRGRRGKWVVSMCLDLNVCGQPDNLGVYTVQLRDWIELSIPSMMQRGVDQRVNPLQILKEYQAARSAT